MHHLRLTCRVGGAALSASDALACGMLHGTKLPGAASPRRRVGWALLGDHAGAVYARAR
jgi:hypothetical protein